MNDSASMPPRPQHERGYLVGLWKALRQGLLACALYLVAAAGFFWQLLFLPDVSVPKGGGDLASFLYPAYAFAAGQLQHGVFPLWNPYLFSGSPFAADLQSGLYYPLNLIAFLVSRPFTYRSMELLAIVHYPMMASFAYLYGRRIGLNWPGSFGVGLVLAFGGFSVIHLAHLNMLAAATWLPLILLLFHNALDRRSLLSAVAAGAVFGISILAGHTQIALYTALLLALYWLWVMLASSRRDGWPRTHQTYEYGGEQRHLAQSPEDEPATRVSKLVPPSHKGSQGFSRSDRKDSNPSSPPALDRGLADIQQTALHTPLLERAWRSYSYPSSDDNSFHGRRRMFLSLPVCFAFALGLATVQLLPLAELLPLSLRSDITYAKALEFAASPIGLITMVVPHFFGDSPVAYWGVRWSLTEVYGYAGVIPLLLAPFVLWIVRPRRSLAVFFGVLALLALLLSLGEHTVLYGWLYRFAPGFDKVRAPGRFLLLLNLAIAVLAGYGIDLLSHPLRARFRPAYGVLLRLIGLVLAGGILLGGPIFYYALLTSQDKDAAIFGRISAAIDSYNLFLLFLASALALLAAYRWRRHRIVPYLVLALLTLDLFSANAALNPTRDDLLIGYRHERLTNFLRSQETRIDTATGIADVWQPDAALLYQLPDVLGLFNPMTLTDYQRYWENLGSRSVPGYDLLNVGYVIGRKDVVLDHAKFELTFDADHDLAVFRNRTSLPRAFLVGSSQALTRDEQLVKLRDAAFDPRESVLLDPNSPVVSGEARGRVQSVRDPNPNEVIVSLEGTSQGYLLLADVYYPGWRALIDGKETPVLRADYVFRAVAVPAGANEVRFVYIPRIWQFGLLVTLATILAMIAVFLLSRMRREAR